MPVGETGHARGRVLFVRLDGVEVVVIRWWLSKDFLESGTACLDVGYVRDGFPYDVGEMMRTHEMRNVVTEYVSRLGCCSPVGVFIVQWSMLVGRAAVVSFEFC